MSWVSGCAFYLIIWWVVLFAVLPWGVQTISSEDVGKGHASSAPRNPRILMKAAITSVIAGVIWGAFYWAFEAGWIGFSG